MSDEKPQDEILSRATAAAMKHTKVRLDKIKFDTERYCHRDPIALKSENLTSLMESLTLEGMQVPIEYFLDDQENLILLKGHRRVSSSRILAGKNVPGFAIDMEVDAIEVSNATPEDRLLRSISDNEVRLNLDRLGRIRVGKKLYDAGVQVERAARAMNVSVKTYERDLLLSKFNWMFQHLIDGSIAPTNACTLLEEAEKADRMTELKEDFDAFVAEKKQRIREKEKLVKAKSGKELAPPDKLVKKYITSHLVKHWVDLLQKKQRFDEDAQWTFAAGIDPEARKLTIAAITLDLDKDPSEKIAKVGSKLSLLAKLLPPYIASRRDEEQGQSESDNPEAAFDLDYLRRVGEADLADELEAQVQLDNEPDGEETLQGQPVERQDADTTQEVKLPPPPQSPPAPATPTPATPTPKDKTSKEDKKK